jgi:hypothetical protein
MKKLFRILLVIMVIGSGEVSIQLYAQESEGMVKYTPDFRFNDGIFLNFDQVKSNAPIPKAKILTSTDYNDKDFFKNLMKGEKIYFYDGMGMRQEVEITSIWGYSRNGVLYIQIQGNFNRVTFIGNICHFVADITSYDNRYYNSPYGYYDPYNYYPYYYPYRSPYYSPYSYGSYYSPYGSYYSPNRHNAGRNELRQYLIDFDTGKIMEYDIENTELLLMRDAELYEEYVQLSNKKQKELMFVYIRKFNERNPLYLPAKPTL